MEWQPGISLGSEPGSGDRQVKGLVEEWVTIFGFRTRYTPRMAEPVGWGAPYCVARARKAQTGKQLPGVTRTQAARPPACFSCASVSLWITIGIVHLELSSVPGSVERLDTLSHCHQPSRRAVVLFYFTNKAIGTVLGLDPGVVPRPQHCQRLSLPCAHHIPVQGSQ